MNKPLNHIKEMFQYAGIIVLSCFSALWLFITGKIAK